MSQPLALRIEGARQNNLKNVSLEIPHDRLTVITGVSGSGKSSLAFDTLFAEGQWRYIESLSSYARMFLDRVDRPDVDRIEQIRPAVALEQKNPVRTARSTVGTATEVYDYLRLLYAKIGRVHCPRCGAPAASHSAESIVDTLLAEHPRARALVTFPLAVPSGLPPAELWAGLTRRGFARVRLGSEVLDLAGAPPAALDGASEMAVVLDRVVLDTLQRSRIVESVETALREGGGRLTVEIVDGPPRTFAEEFQCGACATQLERPQPLLFSFNHPLGACPECKGFGNILKYAEGLVVPDPTLSLGDGAVEPWTHPSGRWYQRELVKAARRTGVALDRPWEALSATDRAFVYAGDGKFPGIDGFFEEIESYRYKLHVRVFLSRYRTQSRCPVCQGARLKPTALAVRVAGLTVSEFTALTIERAAAVLDGLALTAWEQVVACEILRQLQAKLTFLVRVGLGYLTLARQTRTLSGGEAQRINLANQLGSQLVGTLYVLDEPSIGLHARDTTRLADLCHELADAGNTVVVVEHDRGFIEAADHVVELGPGSGERGGEIVFSGSQEEFRRAPRSLTARYLSGRETIPAPLVRRTARRHLVLTGAREHNLKDVTARFPLGTLTVVSGVSGSGKSTLVHDTLYRALARAFRTEFQAPGAYTALTGIEYLKGVRLIDQEPIGRTPRSNPVTYVKAFDEIRKLFAALPRAKALGLGAGAFSFNVPGGRCEKCQGDGFEKLEMYFFEDVYVSCQECEGRRYRPDVLGVKYRGRSIGDVLHMTIDEAVDFFAIQASLARRLRVMQDVGLGYLRLGQPATTLSGGEAQRLKIASELAARATTDMLYILDEPTTGLHLDDVKKLLLVLHRLVDAGNTVLVVEHHLDVIKCADHVIDLGPEAGEDGGEIVAEGVPEVVAQTPGSYTGKFLAEALPKLNGKR
ncbi:MAG TPA: excinuclease ABC subunit UvrA [Methylomirabilota bacterium]|jgi:excinuclease ABC subunit A|nr:excinuclease ABC subunit UvrA [Methylomirabilota bacterium]